MFFRKGIFLVVLGLLFSIFFAQHIASARGEDIRELTRELRGLLRESKDSGKDVSRAMELDRKSREAFRQRRHDEAINLLKEAISLLKGRKIEDSEKRGKGLRELVKEFKMLLREGQEEGKDVARPLELDKQSVRAAKSGKPDEAERLLREAISLLRETKQRKPEPQEVTPKKSPKTPRVKGYEDSPFGIHGPYIIGRSGYSKSDVTKFLADIGIKWVRIIAPELGAVADDLSKININLYVGVANENSSNDEIKSTLFKYKDAVKYWRIGNEPDLLKHFRKRPKEYVNFLKRVYTIIKSESPDAVITIGGLAHGRQVTENGHGPKFLRSVLDAGGGDYFDVFAFHFQGEEKHYLDLKNTAYIYKKLLKEYGYEKPFWITEIATYDGDPVKVGRRRPDPPYQTEIQQASGLLKRYVYGLSLGIKKMFWNLIIERHKFGGRVVNSYFDNVGLIHNPRNDGKSHKKLSYYTYKKMIEVLEGADWNEIQTIQEKDDIYIFKFTKKGKPIWVAWNDNKSAKAVKIAGVEATKVKVTYAVPKKESGKDVRDYGNAFETKTLSVHNGEVSFNLNDVPVFIEEKHKK